MLWSVLSLYSGIVFYLNEIFASKYSGEFESASKAQTNSKNNKRLVQSPSSTNSISWLLNCFAKITDKCRDAFLLSIYWKCLFMSVYRFLFVRFWRLTVFLVSKAGFRIQNYFNRFHVTALTDAVCQEIVFNYRW